VAQRQGPYTDEGGLFPPIPVGMRRARPQALRDRCAGGLNGRNEGTTVAVNARPSSLKRRGEGARVATFDGTYKLIEAAFEESLKATAEDRYRKRLVRAAPSDRWSTQTGLIEFVNDSAVKDCLGRAASRHRISSARRLDSCIPANPPGARSRHGAAMAQDARRGRSARRTALRRAAGAGSR